MVRSSQFVTGLLIGTAIAGPSRVGNFKRQEGPVDPGTIPDCTWYDTALDSTYNCAFFEREWNLSHELFVFWNPGVKQDCSGIKIGNSYCVEAPTKPTATHPTTTSPSPTTSPKPSPTQEGIINTCVSFYKAISGDSCSSIVDTYGTFNLETFVNWNPAVKADCSGLWVGYYYCVGIPGTLTSKPTSTATITTPTGPSPTQTGIIKTCNRFYKAVSGDSCSSIVDTYGTFNLETFVNWNPAVKADCSGLWVGYYYCIGIPGTPTSKPTSTATTPTGPSPTQTGIIKTCNRFYKTVSGDSCSGIVDKYRTFTLDNFISWNPAVKADCSGLWVGYFYCIGIPGTPTKPITTNTPTPTGCTTPGLPSPTQPGAVCRCKKWHKVVSGDTCESIQKKNNISSKDFNAWNPEVGADCKTLWLGYHVCVGI